MHQIDVPDHLTKISATVEKVRLDIDDSDKVPVSYDLAIRLIGINVDQRKNFFNAIEYKTRTIAIQ